MQIFKFQKLYSDSDGFDYGVHFSKDSASYKYFTTYSKALGDISSKKYDIRNHWWKIIEEDMNKLRELETEVLGAKSKEQEENKNTKKTFPLSITKKDITDYEDMGNGLKADLYPYQKEMVKFCLDNKNSLIVAVCGCGKTITIIATYLEALSRKQINGPGMIVVKASLKNQWLSEIKKFSNFNAVIVQTLSQLNKNKEKFDLQFKGKTDLYILNYEALRDVNIRAAMHKIKPDFVACDEIHLIKDDQTKRSKAIYEFSDAKYKIGATATPVQKNPLDIFGIFKFINPALFPKKGDFGNTYVRWTSFGGYVRRPIGSRNETQLNQQISPYMIVKTKEEISSQLPKLMVLQRNCQLTAAQQEKSDQLHALLAELHDRERSISVKLNKIGANTSDELKQVEAQIMMYQTFAQELCDDEELLLMSDSKRALDFVTGDKSAKTDMAIELIKEIIDSGEKVTIFSRYTRYQDILTKRIQGDKELKGVKIAYVNGGLSSKKRYNEVYEKFKNDDDYKVLLMSDAGAEGISLSWCQYVIEMDLANSYAIQTQRHGRIERADSTHDTVYVYQLLCENSYDDIAQKIVNKKEYFDSAIIRA